MFIRAQGSSLMRHPATKSMCIIALSHCFPYLIQPTDCFSSLPTLYPVLLMKCILLTRTLWFVPVLCASVAKCQKSICPAANLNHILLQAPKTTPHRSIFPLHKHLHIFFVLSNLKHTYKHSVSYLHRHGAPSHSHIV